MSNKKSRSRYQKKRSSINGSTVLLLIGGLVVAAIVAFLAIQLFNTNATANSAATDPSSNTTGPSGTPSNNKPSGTATMSAGKALPQIWYDTLKQTMAQGLNLTVSQLETQIQSGAQIANIATTQGLNQQQLHTLELESLQKAFQQAISQGLMSQDRATQNMDTYNQMNQQLLNDNITNDLGGNPDQTQNSGQ